MATKSVIWTETAINQRRGILNYWIKRNNSSVYAEKLIHLIAKQIKSISKQPNSFKLTDYPNTRESAMGHFSIYYKIKEESLVIVAFWDNRQDPKKLLELISSQ